MKNIFQIIIISIGLLLGQTSEQIKKVKKVIQQRGMSESQARAAAKAQGYTDQQINSAIQKEKSSKSEVSKSAAESVENISLPELGNSNKVFQEKSMSENIELNLDEKISVSGEDNLEVVEESKLDIESQTQPGRRGLTYFGYKIFQQDPELFQAASVGIVDPGYLIGPGDEIIIMLWGETQFRQLLTVDRRVCIYS